jgi:VCBS repeat-containing protein
MPKVTKDNGIIELRSDQWSGEVQYERTSLPLGTPGSNKKIDLVLGYRRSLDFDAQDSPGQDYAAVRADANGYVVGVVADGVSQSFYGHLAAYHVSDSLLNVLWQERTRPPSADELERELKRLEKKVAQEVVENHPIPDNLVRLHREALEDKRSKGSQAVFAAFVLNASRKQLHLYQVGDVDAIVHYPNKRPELIHAPPKGRWSSAGRSEMRLKLTTYDGNEGASGIVIKSDGVGRDWGLKEKALSGRAFALLSEERAGVDDVSFVAARWGEWLEQPEAEGEGSWPPEPVPRPRQEVTEVLPGTKRYDPAHFPPEIPSHRGPYDTDRDQRGAREWRERGTPVRSGTRAPRRPRKRLGNAPLLAAGVAAGVVMAFLIVVVYLKVIENDPPVANSNEYSIAEGQERLKVPVSRGVLGNDSDPNEDRLTVQDEDPATAGTQPARPPSHGTLTLQPKGSFTYTPNAGFTGTDSFAYRASDGEADSNNIAKVTITVKADNSLWRKVLRTLGF